MADGASGAAAPLLDWRLPLPALVSALLQLVPEALSPEEESQAAEKLRSAFASASAHLAVRRDAARRRRGGSALDILPQILFQRILEYAWWSDSAALRSVTPAWRHGVAALHLGQRISGRVLPVDRSVKATELIKTLRCIPDVYRRSISVLKLPLGVQLGPATARPMVQLCPGLQCLELGYFVRSGSVASESLLLLAKGLPQLSRIRLRKIPSCSIPSILDVASKIGKRLLELRIEAVGELEYFTDEHLSRLSTSCPNLREFALHYDGDRYDFTQDSLSGSGLVSLLERCRGLEVLQLGLTTRVKLEAFATIAKKLEASELRLQRLEVYGVVSLESKAGEEVKRRIIERLPRGAFTASEDGYRKLLRSLSLGRSSIFVPSIEYLLGPGIM